MLMLRSFKTRRRILCKSYQTRRRILSLKVDRLLCDQLSSPLPVKPTLQYILHCSVPYICFCSIHISPSCNTCFTLMLNTFEIHFTVVRPTQLSITSSEAVQTHHTALQCNPILCYTVCSVLHSVMHCSVQYSVKYSVHCSVQCSGNRTVISGLLDPGQSTHHSKPTTAFLRALMMVTTLTMMMAALVSIICCQRCCNVGFSQQI